MKQPHWLLLCILAGVMAASACGDGDSPGESHTAAGSAGEAAAGDGAESGTSGAGATGRTSGGDDAGGTSTSGSGSGGEARGGDSVGGAAIGSAGMSGAAGNEVSGGAGAGNGECNAVEQKHPLAAGVHVEACSDITYATNPPSSGEHYDKWADYGSYDFALPRGHWVHNLEHGSVVVTYSCQDCAAEIAAAKSWLAGLEPDASCASGPARVLLVPDPALDVRWAASSWGFTLRADCFDPEAFSDFYVKHAGQLPAPEAAICSTGIDFRASGACGIK
jgi:hypothetical protein